MLLEFGNRTPERGWPKSAFWASNVALATRLGAVRDGEIVPAVLQNLRRLRLAPVLPNRNGCDLELAHLKKGACYWLSETVRASAAGQVSRSGCRVALPTRLCV